MRTAEQKVEYVCHMGSDVNVVNAARVSFAKQVESFDKEKDTKLINYLAKHNHWSPFAHTSITLRVKAPIFVARQLVKHTVGGNWNEESRRYIDSEPEFYVPDSIRGRAVNAKQGSGSVVGDSSTLASVIYRSSEDSLGAYNLLLGAGVCPEQARAVLPQNTMTNWVWTGNLAFFARVYKLRIDGHAQKEVQDVAKMIDNVVAPLYPSSWQALKDYMVV